MNAVAFSVEFILFEHLLDVDVIDHYHTVDHFVIDA